MWETSFGQSIAVVEQAGSAQPTAQTLAPQAVQSHGTEHSKQRW